MPARPISEVLARAERLLASRSVPNARWDAELLLEHALGIRRHQWLLEPTRAIDPTELSGFASALRRRCRREPLQYILGSWDFYGRPFELSPAALIPRPETEVLVEAVLEELHGARGPVADVGTGTGIIAITLAVERSTLELYALDLDGDALELAARNAASHGVESRLCLLQGHLLEPLVGRVEPGTLEAVVSNPPYVSLAERPGLEPEVRDWEPARALYAGESGLELVNELIDGAAPWLRPAGLLALELGHGQAAVATRRAREQGYCSIRVLRDLSGRERVLIARRSE